MPPVFWKPRDDGGNDEYEQAVIGETATQQLLTCGVALPRAQNRRRRVAARTREAERIIIGVTMARILVLLSRERVRPEKERERERNAVLRSY